MSTAKIPVEVGPGMFSSERAVSIRFNGTAYNLVVDHGDVTESNMLNVFVIQRGVDESIVDLPRETFTSGNRIKVPTSLLR
ncbi:MAG: hypothetical protein HUU21_00400 [Polyangiaceae bacterium]|nr:hypothetical protein [Polyangiaceae bacterium]